MNVKDVTVTFTLEADVDAFEFMDSILLVNGQNNWPAPILLLTLYGQQQQRK